MVRIIPNFWHLILRGEAAARNDRLDLWTTLIRPSTRFSRERWLSAFRYTSPFGAYLSEK